ncbi:hypothetical protein QNI19_35095 [Cytophagaceae bacterium DM2B3-1]|uniref:Uncharacterized protein n=1 Tax=Xanthocytophaga flava TaxID=3048013 RepID=A0ABT7CWS5_9BACT|nr:hypothetical protein [Xanthocytophaga flavus]MDJ1498223.1 hypothetical protein [Xanthocytophaga flavus]
MWSYLKKVFANNKKEVKHEKGKLLSAWLSNTITSPLTIKELVRSARIVNERILVEWDAGGDSRCLKIKVGDEYDDRFFGELCSEIVEKLQLPHTGEYYNKGYGEVDVNEKDQIILKYSTRAYYEDYGSEPDLLSQDYEPIIEWVELEDVFGLTQYLHRITISCSVDMMLTEDGKVKYRANNPLLNIRIHEGDEVILPVADINEFYLDVLKKHLHKREEEFVSVDNSAGNKVLESISIYGTFLLEGIQLELQKNYVVIDYIVENKSVVLIY